MIPKTLRLSRREFQLVFRNGKKIYTSFFSGIFSPGEERKFSVSVPASLLRTSVQRNRIRRRLYSALQRSIPLLPKILLIVFPTRRFLTISRDEAQRRFAEFLEKAMSAARKTY